MRWFRVETIRCGETQDSGCNELRQQMPRGCSCPHVQLLNPFWCPPPLTQRGLAVGLERVSPKSHTHATGKRMLWLCRAERKHHHTRAFILACVSPMHRSTALRLGYASHGDTHLPSPPLSFPPLPSHPGTFQNLSAGEAEVARTKEVNLFNIFFLSLLFSFIQCSDVAGWLNAIESIFSLHLTPLCPNTKSGFIKDFGKMVRISNKSRILILFCTLWAANLITPVHKKPS